MGDRTVPHLLRGKITANNLIDRVSRWSHTIRLVTQTATKRRDYTSIPIFVEIIELACWIFASFQLELLRYVLVDHLIEVILVRQWNFNFFVAHAVEFSKLTARRLFGMKLYQNVFALKGHLFGHCWQKHGDWKSLHGCHRLIPQLKWFNLYHWRSIPGWCLACWHLASLTWEKHCWHPLLVGDFFHSS